MKGSAHPKVAKAAAFPAGRPGPPEVPSGLNWVCPQRGRWKEGPHRSTGGWLRDRLGLRPTLIPDAPVFGPEDRSVCFCSEEAPAGACPTHSVCISPQ